MPYLAPSTLLLQSTKRIRQGAILYESQRQSPHTTSIHILDDDSLLYIFYLYRPAIFDGNEGYFDRIRGGKGWDREKWWYKLAHVCQRWRNIILGSASYLRLSLVCTYGTPVADMLAHSPPFPLIIEYNHPNRNVTTEDEEGIIVALGLRDRVCRVRLLMPVLNLQKLIMAIDEEYSMLEYLIMLPPNKERSSALMLPETFQAPHLRHLLLKGFAFPIRFRLLTTAVGIVTLCLYMNHPSSYFQPNTLLQWVSFMPQLETLLIDFLFSIPNREVERQLMRTPIMTPVTLPNLRFFVLQSVSAYMEAVVPRMVTPRLEKLDIWFFNQLTFSIPRFLQFLNTTVNLRFDSAKFEFCGDKAYAGVYLREEVESVEIKMIPLLMVIHCWHLDWQVSAVAQIFNSFGQILSTVDHLTLKHREHGQSSEEHNEVDRIQWRRLLRSFSNVKTLRVDNGLIKELSGSLRLDDGELPLELLPELEELTCSGSGDTGDAFTSFIDARQNAGRPVSLIHPNPRSTTPEIWDW